MAWFGAPSLTFICSDSLTAVRASLYLWNKAALKGVYLNTLTARIFTAALIVFASIASAQTSAFQNTVTLPPAPLLPQAFGAWKQISSTPVDVCAGTASSSTACVEAKEFGVKRSMSATYERVDGKKTTLNIEAQDMQDATGAYAAFTLQRGLMHDCASTAKLGQDCALAPGQLLFWKGETLVRIKAEGTDPIRLPELQPLVDALPKPSGTKAALPVLPYRLPKKGLQSETVRYAVGPATYNELMAPVDAALIDFTKSPEIIFAKYAGATKGLGSLTIIYYPTPQIAGNRERAIAAALRSNQPDTVVRRVATMVVIAGGAFNRRQAEALVDQVKPNEEFTFNDPSSYVPQSQSIQTTVSVVAKIIVFVIIMTLAAAVLGIFFGGARALIRKAQGKPLSSLEDMEIIKLEIGGKPSHKLVSESMPEGELKRE